MSNFNHSIPRWVLPTRSKELRGKDNIYRIWLAKKLRIAYEIDEKWVIILRVRLKEEMDDGRL